VPGLDQVAEDVLGSRPDLVGPEQHTVDVLFDLLKAGNRKPMSESLAYERALEHLRSLKEQSSPTAEEIQDANRELQQAGYAHAPAARGPQAAVGGGVLRENLATMARQKEIATDRLKAAERFFDQHILGAPDEATRTARFLRLTDAIETGAIGDLPQEFPAEF